MLPQCSEEVKLFDMGLWRADWEVRKLWRQYPTSPNVGAARGAALGISRRERKCVWAESEGLGESHRLPGRQGEETWLGTEGGELPRWLASSSTSGPETEAWKLKTKVVWTFSPAGRTPCWWTDSSSRDQDMFTPQFLYTKLTNPKSGEENPSET